MPTRDKRPETELRGTARRLRDSLTTSQGVEIERSDTLLRAGLSLLLAIVMSVVDTVLLNPLPYGEPDRLVYIGATAPGSDPNHVLQSV